MSAGPATTSADRVITAETKETYRRDGVVCLRGVADAAWTRSLLRLWDDVSADPARFGFDTTAKERGQFTPGAYAIKHLCRTIPEFRRFIAESPVPELVGRLLGSRRVGFMWDQFFAKDAGTTGKTPWHNDAPGWPVKGEQLPGVWMALTPTTRDNSLECIAGSHRHDMFYWPETPNGLKMTPPPERERCPDLDLRRDDPNVRFLWWKMNPGDALIIHPRTLHYACGNRSATERRVAFATWWYGDDIVWDPRPECEAGPPDAPFNEREPGTQPGGDAFPIMWTDPDQART